jgi:adenylate cyclase
MARAPSSETPMLLRGSLAQRLRLLAGLILLLFVVTHFLNHAAGLFGVEAMERVQTIRLTVTRSWVGSIVLGLALLVHVSLAFTKIAARRTLRMPAWEALQIASGLLIPLLLIDHIVGTRVANLLFGTADFYHPVLAVLWPRAALRQTLLLLLVWGHSAIGVHHLLRLYPWYPQAKPWLIAVGLLVPSLALAGFIVGGREAGAAALAEGGRKALLALYHWPDAAGVAELSRLRFWLILAFVAAASAALALLLRHWVGERLAPQVVITYAGGPTVSGPLGATLLEISRLRGVPHASVCGGRARCSTCRVRIDAGGESLPSPGFAEAVTLAAIAAPPGVRLACQIRPTASLTVTRLVAPPLALGRVPSGMESDAAGAERHLAVMFLDLKGFTARAEKQLPYDVVFLLNRVFRVVGEVVAAEGGWVDKYMGDGMLAVFGRETGLAAGSRAALRAAARIDRALDGLNAELAAEGSASVGVGIGIHAGRLVVGRVGYGEAAQVTVIGETVNLASRLQELTREKGCQLIVSRELAVAAGWPGERFRSETVTPRGTNEPLEVLIVPQAREATPAA